MLPASCQASCQARCRVLSEHRDIVVELAARVRSLVDGASGIATDRIIVGITGAPGAGKSTLAALVAAELGREVATVVPMDGFHLADAVLDDERRARKGAIDTFDGEGFVALLGRLRARDDETVFAPAYVRGLEEPVAASIAVPRSLPVVITEGNYLLVNREPWSAIRGLLDTVWFVEAPESVRRARLIGRHTEFGMSADAAAAWADGTDATNADLVAATKPLADLVVTWGGGAWDGRAWGE